MSSLDLSQSEDVVKYLKSTPFKVSEVYTLSGGTANYTYRLHLSAPFNGRHTLILKHAKPYIAAAHQVKLAVERQDFETEALRRVKDMLPADALVTVPVVHIYDAEHRVIIMDDCGADSRTLKQLMLDDPPHARLAKAIGEGLGQFLAIVHQRGIETQDLLRFFHKNQEGKRISAWATYGRIMETVADGSVGQGKVLIEPPLALPQADLDAISQLANETAEAVRAATSAFVMGDFWPGNIIVKLKNGDDGHPAVERIYVVDWELAKLGLLGADIGQFTAEMHLVRRFHPSSTDSVDAILSSFLETYALKRQVEDATVKMAAIHAGVHLVCWTPRVPWGTMDRTRNVVCEGLQLILRARNGNTEWFKGCIIGGLCCQ